MAKKQSSATSDQPAISSDGGPPSPVAAATVFRPLAETLHANELRTLAEVDRDPRPPGWTHSPRAVRSFLCGGERPPIRRKFYGDDSMVERAIVSLSSNRGLMLVGEPGTAKSMLSGHSSRRQAWWTAPRDEHSGGDQRDLLPFADGLRMASLAA